MPTGAANAPPSDPAYGRQRLADAPAAGLTPAGNSRHTLVLIVVVLLTFTVGYLGQGFWRIGARARPPTISAIATDAAGGVGNREPVRVRVTIAVANEGAEEIQVIAPAEVTPGVTIVGLDPGVLAVPAGRVGQLAADIALHCEQSSALTLPDLRVELVDGGYRTLEVGGSGKLLEACARTVSTARPLAVSVGPARPDASNPADQRLSIRLSSPTGRRVDVSAIRAGGVSLLASPLPAVVTGTPPTTVRLVPPRSCPVQWQVTGLPSVLVFDLGPDSGSGSATTLQLKPGPALTSWLLATSCAGGP